MILTQRILAVSVLIWLAGTLALPAQNTNAFELRDGERVVLLGDTFIEREQRYGHIEYLFTTHWPDRNITFRNLGWSADTPEGISRPGFDPDEKGWHHLTNQLAAVKPTAVVLGYGMANSFAGEAGLTNFITGINRIIDTVQQIAGKEPVRWLILSPIAHEKLPPPLPDPEPHNGQLAVYTKALKDIAAQRQAHFVSLFEHLNQANYSNAPPITDNGIHLTDYGYRRAAETISMHLRLEPHIWRLGVTLEGTLREGGFGARILEFSKTNDTVRFVTVEEQLSHPSMPSHLTNHFLMTPDNRVQIYGLRQGTYDVLIDNKPYRRMRDLDFIRSGRGFNFGPPAEQAQELLETIIKKNELFFHRWRPQNNTYLFLFRKHEQGQNAGEIPKFDPLVQEQEAKIAKLRVPVPHIYEITYNTNVFVGVAPEVRENARAPVTTKPQTPFRPQPVPTFEVEPGFEISLFAENPQLAKPVQMNFDPQGRLWVASSSVYPQIAPGQEADDKILILEDTNRDGRADKTTVFADNLLIPTGVEPGDGGVYVGQSTELLHFKDTDGDGVADEKRIVLSGFGTEDTHHTLHTLRWGFDGQLYMNQSIYIHSHIETPHGVVRLRSGGILNLRPSTMKCDIFLKGLINGWGHHYDLYGQSFATDGAGGAPPNGIFYVVPGAMYAAYENARRIMGSISPGSYPKFCGLEVVYSQHFPPEWQGNMITCDFRANRIVRFAVEEQKSAYVTRQMPDLLRTTNVTFRPIDVKIGPDGALYIADWSNPIINHGEVDFRDPRRDRVHGRIWRVTAKGRPLVNKPNFHQADNNELFPFLISSNEFSRQQSRRVLAHRGEMIRKDLQGWVDSHVGDERAQLEALWLYQSLVRTNLPIPLLHKLLDAKDGRVRAAAIRVVGDWHSDLWSPVDLLSAQVSHPFARVRLEAVRTLARIPSARSAELVLSALNHPMDEFLDYAIWLSINELAADWIRAVESGVWKIEGREKQLEFGLKAIPSAQASRVLSKLLATRPISSGNMIELIGQAGGSKELERLFSEAADVDTARALNALAEAARLRGAKPERDLDRISKFLAHDDKNVRRAAVRVAGTWKVTGAIPEVAKAVEDQDLRTTAFEALREIGKKGDALERLRELATKRDLGTRRQAAATLAAIDLGAGVPLVIAVLRETRTEDEALALWRDVLTVKGAGPALARAVPKASLPEPVAKAGLRAARESARSEADLVIALSPSGQPQELTRAEIEQIARRVKDGDPARGEQIYRRKELSCITCHAIGGAGGKVGPDMTSVGASSPVDYLVESLFMPNSKVKEGYNSVILSTKDNDEFSGILAREDADQVVLLDATNNELSVPKKNIGSRKIGGSLMPSGLLEALSPSERLDLLRFLSELGKPGAYDATKQSIARVWRVSLNDDGDVKAWGKLFTTVGGALQKSDLETELPLANRREPFFAAARFQTATHGAIKLILDGVQTPKAWLDGKPIGGNTELTADLSPGIHTFKLKLDPAALSTAIRLEVSDGAFLVD